MDDVYSDLGRSSGIPHAGMFGRAFDSLGDKIAAQVQNGDS